MTAVMEYALTPEVEPSSDIRQILDTISSMDSADEQFQALGGVDQLFSGRRLIPGEISTDDFDALVDFAADPSSSPSLIVRAQALEAAVNGMYGSIRDGAADDGMCERRAQLRELIPDDLAGRVYYARTPLGDLSDPAQLGYNPVGYQSVALELAKREGIPEETLFPDWHYWSFDPHNESDNNPVQAILVLDRLWQLRETPELIPVNPLTARIVPFALELGAAYREEDYGSQIDPFVGKYFKAAAQLSRSLEFGEDYSETIAAFLREPSPEKLQYIQELNELYDAASLLKEVFPEAYAEGVGRGAKELIASALYAVHTHMEHGGKTRVRLPVNELEDILPLNMSGEEPLHLLRMLKSAMQQLHQVTNNPELRTVSVSDTSDYRLYRLLSPGGPDVSVYIRPEGACAFNDRLEYGMAEGGVEASISYVIDPLLPPNQLLEVGKHRRRGDDSRISIRLDLEGVAPHLRGESGVDRDPTAKHCTLSLDVGSVVGHDTWVSTKVGRLLAWGNHLRSQAIGTKTNLNHVTHYFSETDGSASVFAHNARVQLWEYESRRMSAEEIARYYVGHSALNSL